MKIRKILWSFGWLIGIIFAAVAIATNAPSFGGEISGERLARVTASIRYEDGAFVNVERQAPMDITWDYLQQQFFGSQLRIPPGEIPVVKIDPQELILPPAPGLRATWIGHAGVLIEVDGYRVLVDPVFSDYASPFQFVGPQRFHPPPIALNKITNINAVMISHDHYDHLDMATMQHLAPQGTQYFVPLGVGAHLEKWGIPANQINELDWWEEKTLGELKVVCTPNRHYSGRGFFDYKATLWSSWSVLGPKHRFFYSGDTGYSKLFGLIGDRLGPFDLSIIKVGAYGPGDPWLDIHMTPEDAIAVHTDVQAKRMLPVHWGTFNLAIHAWDEPIKRALIAASERNVDLVTPRVGEVVVVGKPFNSSPWWEQVK